MSNREPSEHYGALQEIVDGLFGPAEEALTPGMLEALVLAGELDAVPSVRRLDVVIAAEAADLPEDLIRIVSLLPPGDYTRQQLCDQLNSGINGHAWGQVYGTVL